MPYFRDKAAGQAKVTQGGIKLGKLFLCAPALGSGGEYSSSWFSPYPEF
jgi:hypothetical protein